MKTYKITLSFFVLLGITLIAACDGPESPSKEQQFLNQLTFSWTLHSASVGGKDVTSSFPGLNLSISSDRSYTVVNAVAPIWPESGTFTLEPVDNSDLFNIVRDDGAVITVIELSETVLKYTMPYTSAGGRTKSVSGNYEFVMTR